MAITVNFPSVLSIWWCYKGGNRLKGKKTYPLTSLFLLSSIAVALCAGVEPAFACPTGCFCAPHSKNVLCANKGFNEIPPEIPPDTIELILNENKFTNTGLTRRNFTGLRDVENLYLKECGIETVAVETFSDLKQLQRLDISRNKIRFLADFTFRGLHLKHLNIDGNVGLQLAIRAFAGMTTQGLYMHECGLRRLPVELMTPLNGSLKILWLHGNNFESLNDKWLYFFRTLGHIRLGGNSFHCNCELEWLYAFYQASKNSLFSAEDVPACGSPGVLKGRKFDDLTAEDFRCQLPTFRNVDAVFDSKVGKLSCSAGGDPAPTLYWIRPDGTTEKFYPRDLSGTASEKLTPAQILERHETQGVLFLTGVKLEDKENYRCVASNPAGNVTFSLNVVWPNLKQTQYLPPIKLPSAKQPNYSKGSSTGSGNGDNSNADGDTNVIRDVMETSSGSPGRDGKGYKNYAGDDSEVYGWRSGSSSKAGGSQMEQAGGSRGSSKKPVRRGGGKKSGDGLFNTVDIVGAVIGTFVLTLLLCVTVFHFYYRRRERLRQKEEHHYSVPDQIGCPHHPHQYPLPHHPLTHPPVGVYVMAEGDENAIKMINHHHGFECPS
ncbi:leucine-rich repeat and fibronectin type iii domain-containing protein 1-like protein [Plakobranchus ocellatus]|uniref:Leucine-rich repeat and fibronectin type iii domain-containing protein 1-like protein n=1 Tax=Plakobranchus ocellatus TaxID=259542 RepID=A0AAV4CV18_9GAST|nr:leucine-rich repeat and fibronectin type iii domain-containing protein 1-like protein [Plakobranchus ocellatus]